MLPINNPKLEAFFSSLSLTETPETTTTPTFEVVPRTLSTDGNDQFEAKPLFLTYDISTGFTPESAIRIVAKELAAAGHLDDISVALAVLAFYANTSRTNGAAITLLSKIISSISDAEVTEYLISPFPIFPGLQRFTLGDFEAGALNYDHLNYWCERVKCDYFKRYPGRHRGNFCLQRKAHKIRLIDRLAVESRLSSNFFGHILSNYFEAITRCLLDRFRTDAWTAQEILIAFGAPFIDFNNFQIVNGSTFISLFKNIGSEKAGYFCPVGHGLMLNYSKIDEQIPRIQSLLEKTYGFLEPGSHQIGTTLRSFCRFLARARLHECSSRVSESFLHHAIALDLLFGDRETVSLSISRRAAVCLYSDQRVAYDEALKNVKSLYNIRSRYVHAGIIINLEALDEIKKVTDAVLRCLMRFHTVPFEDSKQKEIAWWHRQLDYIASKLEAGKEASEEDLCGLGLRGRGICSE